MTTGAGAAGRTANIMPGLSVGDACYNWTSFPAPNHKCWHDDELGVRTALDLNAWSGVDGNKSVNWNQWGADSSQVVTVLFSNVAGTSCTGITATITTPGVSGEFNYKHINPQAGVAGSTTQSWFSAPGYYQGTRLLGTTATSQPNCSWTGPHLHQSGKTDAATDVWTNWSAPESGCATLCNWSSSTWVHQVRW